MPFYCKRLSSAVFVGFLNNTVFYLWDEVPSTLTHFNQQIYFYHAALYYIAEDSNYVQ
jgi:hypothetical protein